MDPITGRSPLDDRLVQVGYDLDHAEARQLGPRNPCSKGSDDAGPLFITATARNS